MTGISSEALRTLILFAPPFILSLSIHEWAHAWSAHKLGDSTADQQGRLTLDPMAHISWFGTVIFPAIAILSGTNFLFGWAKPVPVDPRNFRKPLRDMALVAAAGPASNLIIAFFLSLLLVFMNECRILELLPPGSTVSNMSGSALEMLSMALQLNLFLAVFNLLPIAPLDGSKILQGFMSVEWAQKIEESQQYSHWILLFLLFSGVLKYLAIPVFFLNKLFFSLSMSLFQAAC